MAIRKVLAIVATSIMIPMIGDGVAGAVDGTNQIVDTQQRTVRAVLFDTRIAAVPPLDGNPTTREWFHDGVVGFDISGPNADSWKGKITIGYQVGYPAALTGRLKFGYKTPGLGVNLGGTGGPQFALTDLIPQGGIEAEVSIGPGIKEIAVATGEISGASGQVRIAGVHGTVSGVVGPANIRPFVSVTTPTGDTVVAYGPIWSL
ncbi:MspA family porin [Nocardia sp. NPDC052566]|uniref:MspA family porin n=1 Tax=Nocardia sp. NPDC052566 TaxID=3364330 RepID=UPI0037C85B16